LPVNLFANTLKVFGLQQFAVIKEINWCYQTGANFSFCGLFDKAQNGIFGGQTGNSAGVPFTAVQEAACCQIIQ